MEEKKLIDIDIDKKTAVKLREFLIEFRNPYLNNIHFHEEHHLYLKGYKAGFESAFAILITFLDMKIDEGEVPF